MKKTLIYMLTLLTATFLSVSVAGAGFMSDMGNMVKEDVKKAAADESQKIVDKSVEHAKAKALNATSEKGSEVMEKAQKAQELKEKAEETKHNAEKMHEMGTKEMEKWKNMYHHD